MIKYWFYMSDYLCYMKFVNIIYFAIVDILE